MNDNLEQSILYWHTQQPDLRDQFAMVALTGLLTKYGNAGEMEAAKAAYDIANAMMKARETK